MPYNTLKCWYYEKESIKNDPVQPTNGNDSGNNDNKNETVIPKTFPKDDIRIKAGVTD